MQDRISKSQYEKNLCPSGCKPATPGGHRCSLGVLARFLPPHFVFQEQVGDGTRLPASSATALLRLQVCQSPQRPTWEQLCPSQKEKKKQANWSCLLCEHIALTSNGIAVCSRTREISRGNILISTGYLLSVFPSAHIFLAQLFSAFQLSLQGQNNYILMGTATSIQQLNPGAKAPLSTIARRQIHFPTSWKVLLAPAAWGKTTCHLLYSVVSFSYSRCCWSGWQGTLCQEG